MTQSGLVSGGRRLPPSPRRRPGSGHALWHRALSRIPGPKGHSTIAKLARCPGSRPSMRSMASPRRRDDVYYSERAGNSEFQFAELFHVNHFSDAKRTSLPHELFFGACDWRNQRLSLRHPGEGRGPARFCGTVTHPIPPSRMNCHALASLTRIFLSARGPTPFRHGRAGVGAKRGQVANVATEVGTTPWAAAWHLPTGMVLPTAERRGGRIPASAAMTLLVVSSQIVDRSVGERSIVVSRESNWRRKSALFHVNLFWRLRRPRFT